MKQSPFVKESNSGSWNKRTMHNGMSLMNTDDLQCLNKDAVTKLQAKSGMQTTFSIALFKKSNTNERQLKAIKRLVRLT